MAENKNYDSQFCGNLAIHQTNSIQDYGYLLVISTNSMEIIQGSENIIDITGKSIRDIIGLNFSEFLSEDDAERLKKELNTDYRTRIPFRCTLVSQGKETMLEILMHIQADQTILEIEETQQMPERSFSEVFQEVRSFISILEHSNNLEEICQLSILEIRRLSGFDGIRMYRFDENWNGTVIAEEIEGALESYLGQTFPASDVPKQARALYIKNPYRLIPNRNYVPSKLFPVINPITNGFLDLSDCNLRSIAAVHLEYMSNMNVTASMSIRVMVDGVLWGLISCHHITEKYLNVELRSIFEWLSMEISYRISAVIKNEELHKSGAMLEIKGTITEQIFAKGNIKDGLINDTNKSLLRLLNATGFAIILNGKISTSGEVPPMRELEDLFLWTAGKAFGNVFHTNELSDSFEEAKSFKEVGSGIMIIPISAESEDFIICFRPEVIKSIKWGGNPNEAFSMEKDGLSYHPRNSFKLWLETVHGQSLPWLNSEIEAAESLRRFMVEFSSSQPSN
ncbi:GAF domain-containing protein [Pedobacter xixiisoli]|uniref:GAF domain-containing protein n=1 Tax=Pedobacter xixiisoli TaxID=1476464 RepID=A0A285ZSD0_9SPHI|nr:GAF domain-containing protein [Pedobacter xixiisoli]SOD12558.1 GAF domain-containing protein [Pedobacter xixiisoli]